MKQLFGVDRGVIYLEDAVTALDSADGSQEQAITRSIEKFLDSPQSAFSKSVEAYVWQVRDLGTNTRAFATWCQNKSVGCELCVIHYIYRKKNEKHAFDVLPQFNSEGKHFHKRVDEMTESEYSAWKQQVRTKDAYRVVFSD